MAGVHHSTVRTDSLNTTFRPCQHGVSADEVADEDAVERPHASYFDLKKSGRGGP
jgi:hypothetical protein